MLNDALFCVPQMRMFVWERVDYVQVEANAGEQVGWREMRWRNAREDGSALLFL